MVRSSRLRAVNGLKIPSNIPAVLDLEIEGVKGPVRRVMIVKDEH